MKQTIPALGLGVIATALAACAPQMAVTPMQAPVSTLNSASGTPARYYNEAEGQRGQALVHTLGSIVSKHRNLGYARARDVMFADVDDQDDNDVVECDYTDRHLAKVNDRQSAYRGGKGFNAEHTWPQSKGAVGAAKADLHHLFPTDCEANSRRGSYPFGEVVRVQWQEGGSKLGLDAHGRRVFEPRDEQKGNTARALFYFYTVYGQRASLENFRVEEAVLRQWHREDPVSALERGRNEQVFKFQGNRNPFIDRPEFVDAVGSFLGSGEMPSFTLR